MNPDSYQPSDSHKDEEPVDASQLFKSTGPPPEPVYDETPIKRRIPGKIKLIIVLMAVLVITLGVSVLFPAKKKTADQTTATTTSTETASSGSGKDYALSQNVKLTKAPTWGFPDSYNGWKANKTLPTGYSQLEQWTKTNDETIFSLSAKPAYILGGSKDSANTTAVADAYVNALRASLSTPASIADSTSKVSLKGGGRLEFAQRDFVYSTSKGLYKARALFRSVDGYTVSIQYGAQAAKFSDTEWKTLLSKTELELTQP